MLSKPLAVWKHVLKQLCGDLNLYSRLALDFWSFLSVFGSFIFHFLEQNIFIFPETYSISLCFVSNSHSRFKMLTTPMVFCVTALNWGGNLWSIIDIHALSEVFPGLSSYSLYQLGLQQLVFTGSIVCLTIVWPQWNKVPSDQNSCTQT